MRPRHRRLVLVPLIGALLLPSAAAIAATAPVAADVDEVNDFDYASWHSRYELGLDDDGRSTAHVTETLVADFPDSDQNKGIVRGYPERYEGAGLDLEIVSVSDESGNPVPYEVDDGDDGMAFVLTGDDDYVQGQTTYVIEYTMRDVIIPASHSGLDEFYWDLLPMDSTQNVAQFSADVVLSSELATAYTGEKACYQGAQGEAGTCTLEGPSSDGNMFVVRSGALPAGEGITVAIGFEPGTVTQPSARQSDPLADFGPLVASGIALLLSIASWIAWVASVRRRRKAGGFVVAQHSVPDDLPPLAAAALIPGATSVIPAQIVHLAVRGAVRIEEDPDAAGSPPTLRLLDRSRAADPLDRRTLDKLFPDDATTREIADEDEDFADEMAALATSGEKAVAQRGWTTKERSKPALIWAWAAAGVLLAAIALLVLSIIRDRELMVLGIVSVIVALMGVGVTLALALSRTTVLTPEGAERYAYLQGVKEFIRVAEADRIRMLQSNDGAERRADGDVDVVVLYEKLLPYAMLFGEEKSWAGVLESAYADADYRADWIVGTSPMTFAVLMSSFSRSTESAATYSASTGGASSIAGGAMGGGFSGGGGGGGFSGGR